MGIMENIILRFERESWTENYEEEICCFIEEIKALKKHYKRILQLHTQGKISSFKYYQDQFEINLKFFDAKINELMNDIESKIETV